MGTGNKYGDEDFFADLQKFGSAASSGADKFVADLNRPDSTKNVASIGLDKSDNSTKVDQKVR
jgi:hypothetical protein|tara:strand:+ start:3970 stop:4158 length:189 start_codon:yes stop_codon:yes gene_type:complete